MLSQRNDRNFLGSYSSRYSQRKASLKDKTDSSRLNNIALSPKLTPRQSAKAFIPTTSNLSHLPTKEIDFYANLPDAKVVNDYFDYRRLKMNKRIEEYKEERKRKEEGELRKKPQINSNSKKIAKSLAKKTQPPVERTETKVEKSLESSKMSRLSSVPNTPIKCTCNPILGTEEARLTMKQQQLNFNLYKIIDSRMKLGERYAYSTTNNNKNKKTVELKESSPFGDKFNKSVYSQSLKDHVNENELEELTRLQNCVFSVSKSKESEFSENNSFKKANSIKGNGSKIITVTRTKKRFLTDKTTEKDN